MKLNEALKAVAATRELPVGDKAFLACGFEPLHLPVFLRAQYAQRFADRALDVAVGVYGDLLGNLERARGSGATLAWLVLEWSDVDPRLGLRSTGPWSGSLETVVLGDAVERLNRLREGIARVAEHMPLVVASPSVSFPLLGHTSGWQASTLELELELELTRCLSDVARIGKVSVLHAGRLAAASHAPGRSDPRLELAAGFPYTLEHASALAQGLLELGFPRAPKKGLITDLDDTLWSGIVGEVGPEAVSWSQAEHTQLHAVYQLFLRQLADAGVLLAIASKNEPEVVRAALARHDLLVGDAFFPIAVSWGPKSEAVSAILRAWNIAADAVVMVDDSRMELEEIRRVHPGIECIEFMPKDARRTLDALVRLRDAFGKPRTLAEDKLRAASIKSSALFEQHKSGGDLKSFLLSLDGTVTFDARPGSDGGRWLELINKTNQFNLNGARVSEGEWLRRLGEPGHVALGVAYADRYGALGTIAVVSGRVVRGSVRRLEIDHWVLSCRAFSRRIEDQTLAHLFDLAGVDVLSLSYAKTQRNQPLREFLDRLGLLPAEDGPIEIQRGELVSRVPDLPHRVMVAGQE
jgi:FkbH-like protein